MQKLKPEITIIRSAVGSPASISFIKKLQQRNARVIGLDSDPLSSGLYICDKGYVVPNGSDANFLNKLLEICEIEKPDIILSGPEEEIITLSKNKKPFEEKNILVLCPDYETVKICTDKLLSHKFFESISIPVPKIFDKKNTKFPCIIKPRQGRGGHNVFKINNLGELNKTYPKINQPVIQEFVTGVEYSIDVFCDTMGEPLSIIPRRRLHTESGISTKGITDKNKKIIYYTKKILKKLKIIGPACIQCIDNNGTIKFLEINVRFGGGSILSMEADPSIISNLFKLSKKKTTKPSSNFKENLVMLRYYDEVFVDENKLETL